MSTSRASFSLPSVKRQKHDFQVFCIQCIIKQLLDSVFVICRITKASVRVISLSLRLRLITRTSTLIILDITKTSSITIVYNLRGKMKLILPRANTSEYGLYNFRYYGPKMWNSLQDELRTAPTIKHFLSQIRKITFDT